MPPGPQPLLRAFLAQAPEPARHLFLEGFLRLAGYRQGILERMKSRSHLAHLGDSARISLRSSSASLQIPQFEEQDPAEGRPDHDRNIVDRERADPVAGVQK